MILTHGISLAPYTYVALLMIVSRVLVEDRTTEAVAATKPDGAAAM
jgi:hypothetical protein